MGNFEVQGMVRRLKKAEDVKNRKFKIMMNQQNATNDEQIRFKRSIDKEKRQLEASDSQRMNQTNGLIRVDEETEKKLRTQAQS